MIKNVEKILEKFTRRAEKQIQDSREKEAVNLKREQQIIYWRTGRMRMEQKWAEPQRLVGQQTNIRVMEEERKG